MSLTFDGHDFATLFVYGDPKIDVLAARPEFEKVPGRNGQAFIGMTYNTSDVSFSIAAPGTASQRRAAFSTLGKWLMVDEPKELVLPDTPDRYYLAVPNGKLNLKRGIAGEKAQITFTLVDPVAYGEQKTASLPSGGSVDITIGGTAPAALSITASAAVRNSTSLVWGVKVDDAQFIHVPTGSSSSRRVIINSALRTCTVTGALKLPTLDSDWLVIEPGAHTVQMDQGTGAATLIWRERWY